MKYIYINHLTEDFLQKYTNIIGFLLYYRYISLQDLSCCTKWNEFEKWNGKLFAKYLLYTRYTKICAKDLIAKDL